MRAYNGMLSVSCTLSLLPLLRTLFFIEGKAILKKLGIEGDYEGIGNLILGYAAKPAAEAAPRKADYIYSI